MLFDRTIYFTVPWINIQGQWMIKAGFEINTPINKILFLT